MAGIRNKRLLSPTERGQTVLTPPDTPSKPSHLRQNQGIQNATTVMPSRVNSVQTKKASQRHPQIQPIYYISRSDTQTYIPLIATDEFPTGVSLTLDSNTADNTTGPPVFLGEYSNSGSRFCLDLKTDLMKEEEIADLFSNIVAKMDKQQIFRILSDHGYDLEQQENEDLREVVTPKTMAVTEGDHVYLDFEGHSKMQSFSTHSLPLNPVEEGNSSPGKVQPKFRHPQAEAVGNPKPGRMKHILNSRSLFRSTVNPKQKSGTGSHNKAPTSSPFSDRQLSTRFPTPGDNKKWCSYWIQKGECAYTQQGCKYLHEMPDLAILKTIGFTHVPFWYKQNQEREKRSVDSWKATQLMNANQTRAPNSPFAMPPRPIQSSKTVAPLKHAKELTTTVPKDVNGLANLMDLEDYDTKATMPSQIQTATAATLSKTTPSTISRVSSTKPIAAPSKQETKAGRANSRDNPMLKPPIESLIPMIPSTSELLGHQSPASHHG